MELIAANSVQQSLDMQASVNAINVSNRIAVTNSQEQLRAYVGVNAEDLRFELPGEHDPNYVSVSPGTERRVGTILRDFLVIKITNFGMTPAYAVTAFADITSLDAAQPLPSDFFEFPPDLIPKETGRPRNFAARPVLFPNQSTISKHEVFNLEQIIPARQMQRKVLITGRIYYRDIHGHAWRTKFCYVWEPFHPPGERFVAFERYNDEDKEDLPE